MTRRSFEEDEKTADAVVWNLEIIGEAANRLPPQYDLLVLSSGYHRNTAL